jgi:hypothetical protein
MALRVHVLPGLPAQGNKMTIASLQANCLDQTQDGTNQMRCSQTCRGSASVREWSSRVQDKQHFEAS